VGFERQNIKNMVGFEKPIYTNVFPAMGDPLQNMVGVERIWSSSALAV
jgi:hypothetical protein